MKPAASLSPRSDRPDAIDGPRSGAASQSLAGALASRGLSWIGASADRAGLILLYVGLVLVGLSDLRAFGEAVTIADPFLLGALLCAAVAMIHRGRINLGALRVHLVGAAAFMAGVAIAAILDPTPSWESFLNFTKYVFSSTCLFFTCLVLVTGRGRVITALACWVISACVTSVVGVLQAWLGDAIIAYHGVMWQRMSGLSGNPNHLGVLAGMAIAPALSLAATSRGAVRSAWLLAVVLTVAGVVVSASRTGALAAAGGLLLWLVLHYRLRREFTMLAAACCMAAASAVGLLYVELWGGQSLVARIGSATEVDPDSAVSWRLDQFDAVFRRVMQNPLVGFGLAERGSVYGELVHSMYLRALYGGGVLALLGLLVVLGDVAHKGTRGYLASVSYESRTVAIGLLGALAAMMLAGLTEPLLYQRQVWVPAALLLAFYTRKSGREPSRTRTDYWTRLAPDLRHGRRSRTGGRSGKRRASGGPRESGRHRVAH